MKLTNEKLIEEVHHLNTIISSIIQFLPPNAQHHFQQSQLQENHQQNLEKATLSIQHHSLKPQL